MYSMSLRYEDLVANPESTLKDIVEKLGLDLDPAMLQFHETKRVVFTQSQQRKHQATD